MRGARRVYEPLLRAALRVRVDGRRRRGALVALGGWLAARMGSEFIPSLDEGDIALHALRIPGTGIEQAIGMQTAARGAARGSSPKSSACSRSSARPTSRPIRCRRRSPTRS